MGDLSKDTMIRVLLKEHEKAKKEIEELKKAYADAKSALEEYKKKVEPE